MSCDCLLATELRLDWPVRVVATDRGRWTDPEGWYSIGTLSSLAG